MVLEYLTRSFWRKPRREQKDLELHNQRPIDEGDGSQHLESDSTITATHDQPDSSRTEDDTATSCVRSLEETASDLTPSATQVEHIRDLHLDLRTNVRYTPTLDESFDPNIRHTISNLTQILQCQHVIVDQAAIDVHFRMASPCFNPCQVCMKGDEKMRRALLDIGQYAPYILSGGYEPFVILMDLHLVNGSPS